MKKIIFPIIMCLFMFLVSCYKEIDDFSVVVEEEPPVVLVQSSVRGKVVSDAGIPIPNAIVSIGDNQTVTDNEGLFRFQQIKVKKSGGIVKASGYGYFEGAAHSFFRAKGSSYVEISLMEKGDSDIIESADGGKIVNNSGMSISFPPSSIIDKYGNIHDGPVNIYSRWLNPKGDDLGTIMPGALTSTDDEGNPLVLASYGMMVLELESELGQALDIKPDAEVSVEMPIPAELSGRAPEEIDLWYFDLEEEQWLKKGSCVKDGNKYVCIINTAGYWNCDVALPAICLSGNVFNSDYTYSAYLKVIVEDLTDNFIYWGYTDSTGYFCGSVPGAAPIRITIKDLCDNIVYTEEIGPFSEDFELEDIYLDIVVEEYFINIFGMIEHCLSNDVVAGHIAVRYPGKIRIYPFDAGVVDYSMALKCVEFPNLGITCYSNSQRAATAEISHSDFSDVHLGQQLTCDTLTDYFDLNVQGTDFWTSPTRFYLKNNVTTNWMVLEGLSGAGKFILDIRDYHGVGEYNENIYLTTTNELPSPQYPVLNAISPDIVLNIRADDGEFISGNLSGTALDNIGTIVSISGDFKIRKAL
ncbi:MAG: carboxypeptidase regulatory-like domain-containing protein [Bacteroidetes bacterium]|nr:carboxypeptidase regulatory-like domain-containing protein [Bacteroidota bacterium]